MRCKLDFVFDIILLHYYIIKRVFIVGGGLLLVLVRLGFTNVPPRLNVLDVFARSEKVLGSGKLF